MSAASLYRTLIVANRTASTPILLQEVERRASERPTWFTLLIPSASATDWSLQEALKLLSRAARGATGFQEAHVDGRVGAADAFTAVQHALAEERFDEVIISTLPRRSSQWLRRDLARRVQALGVPVTLITPPAEDPRSLFEKVVQNTPPGMGA
jgi:hypothetical protein